MHKAHSCVTKSDIFWRLHVSAPLKRPTRAAFTVLATGRESASPDPHSGNSSEPLLRPTEPGPEDCCQGGCQECVWDVYSRDLRVRVRIGRPAYSFAKLWQRHYDHRESSQTAPLITSPAFDRPDLTVTASVERQSGQIQPRRKKTLLLSFALVHPEGFLLC